MMNKINKKNQLKIDKIKEQLKPIELLLVLEEDLDRKAWFIRLRVKNQNYSPLLKCFSLCLNPWFWNRRLSEGLNEVEEWLKLRVCSKNEYIL